MKGETQSLHLQKMMQLQKHHPEYALVLAPMEVKRKSLKHLTKGELLLLGLTYLDLYLQNSEGFCAKVVLSYRNETVKLQIVSFDKMSADTSNSKKYEKVFCVFGRVQSRTLDEGHNIEIPITELHEVTLFWEDKKQAAGLLVMVEDEIAIEITEVYNG